MARGQCGLWRLSSTLICPQLLPAHRFRAWCLLTAVFFMEAAFDDVTGAVRFVKAHHGDYGIDPERIVLGGFSAGGRCASYAAYGKCVGVAGVFSISGPLIPADATAYLARGHNLPPLLMISGELDLDYVCTFTPEVEQQFRVAGRDVEWAQVPGANHLYSSESPTRDGRTVFEVIRDSIMGWTTAETAK